MCFFCDFLKWDLDFPRLIPHRMPNARRDILSALEGVSHFKFFLRSYKQASVSLHFLRQMTSLLVLGPYVNVTRKQTWLRQKNSGAVFLPYSCQKPRTHLRVLSYNVTADQTRINTHKNNQKQETKQLTHPMCIHPKIKMKTCNTCILNPLRAYPELFVSCPKFLQSPINQRKQFMF